MNWLLGMAIYIGCDSAIGNGKLRKKTKARIRQFIQYEKVKIINENGKKIGYEEVNGLIFSRK